MFIKPCVFEYVFKSYAGSLLSMSLKRFCRLFSALGTKPERRVIANGISGQNLKSLIRIPGKGTSYPLPTIPLLATYCDS